MQFFRHSIDRLPVFIFLSYFILDILVFLKAESFESVLIWFLIGIPLKAFICPWNHHHQHHLTFRQSWLNRLLELMYSFQTGIGSHAWFLHHVVGHHKNYLDQTKDESRWKDDYGKRYSIVGYVWSVTLTSYWRAFQVGKNYPRARQTFLLMNSLVLILLTTMFIYNPINALFVFVLPMIVSLILTVWTTYFHHSGLETTNPYHAAKNITARWYNIITGNLGYHTAHHLNGGLHWSKLPELHASIEHKIPKHCYHQTLISIKSTPHTIEADEMIISN